MSTALKTYVSIDIALRRHGRACPGHLCLCFMEESKTWMPATSAGMTRRIWRVSAEVSGSHRRDYDGPTNAKRPGRGRGATQSRLLADYSRYRIWSVQNRSSRCSDLLRVENSSALMPPTCSTVRTCFW